MNDQCSSFMTDSTVYLDEEDAANKYILNIFYKKELEIEKKIKDETLFSPSPSKTKLRN